MGSESNSGTSIDVNHLYLLGDNFRKGALRLRLLDELDPRALVRGELEVSRPVSFAWFMGSRLKDMLGTGYAGVFLVSNNFVRTLERGKFKGWTTYPVALRTKDGNVLTGYQGFSVTGRSGPHDPSKVPLVILPPPTEAGKALMARRGLYFDPNTWDGSDVFCPGGSLLVLVTEQVRAAIRAAGLTNVHLDPASEFKEIVV